MRFEKWNALGNDYVIVEQKDLPWELTPARIRALCALHIGNRVGRHPAAVASPRSAASSPGCASSTPTARRPSCPATARARRSCTCASAAGPTRTSSRSRPPPARSARASPGRRPAPSTWAARSDVKDFPSGGDDAAGTPRRPRVPLPARVDRQPAVLDRAIPPTRTSSRFDLRRYGAPIEANTDLFPNRTNVSFWRADWRRRDHRAHLRARRRRDAVVRHRRERRGGRVRPARRRLAGHRPPRRRRPRGRGGGGPAREPDRLGGARLQRHARPRTRQGAQ